MNFLPAVDGRAVEHNAVAKYGFVDCAKGLRRVVPLAARIGEAEVDKLNVLFLDDF